MSYADLAVFKAYLRIGDTVDDVELQAALDTATSSITHLCSRTFEVADLDNPTERYFQPFYDDRSGAWVVPVDDIPTTGALQYVYTWNADEQAWSDQVTGETPPLLRPINAATNGKAFTEILLPTGTFTPSRGRGWSGWMSDDNADYVSVVASFGWLTIPPAIVQATLLQASRVFKRRDAPLGVTSSPDGSENTRLLNRVDPDVEVAVREYIKWWAAR